MNEEGDAEHKDTAPPIRDTSSIQRAVNQAANISTTSGRQGKSRAPCKYFLSKRGCTYGSDCKFLHVVDPTPLETKDEVVKEREGVKSRKSRLQVCRHFIASPSGCKYGDKCRYRHPARPQRATRGEGGTRGSESDEQTLRRTTLTSEERGREEGERVGRQQVPPPPADEPVILSLTSFPGLGSGTAGESFSLERMSST